MRNLGSRIVMAKYLLLHNPNCWYHGGSKAGEGKYTGATNRRGNFPAVVPFLSILSNYFMLTNAEQLWVELWQEKQNETNKQRKKKKKKGNGLLSSTCYSLSPLLKRE